MRCFNKLWSTLNRVILLHLMFALSPYDEGGKLVWAEIECKTSHVGLYEYPRSVLSFRGIHPIVMWYWWIDWMDLTLHYVSHCTAHPSSNSHSGSDQFNFALCFCFEKMFNKICKLRELLNKYLQVFDIVNVKQVNKFHKSRSTVKFDDMTSHIISAFNNFLNVIPICDSPTLKINLLL